MSTPLMSTPLANVTVKASPDGYVLPEPCRSPRRRPSRLAPAASARLRGDALHHAAAHEGHLHRLPLQRRRVDQGQGEVRVTRMLRPDRRRDRARESEQRRTAAPENQPKEEEEEAKAAEMAAAAEEERRRRRRRWRIGAAARAGGGGVGSGEGGGGGAEAARAEAAWAAAARAKAASGRR